MQRFFFWVGGGGGAKKVYYWRCANSECIGKFEVMRHWVDLLSNCSNYQTLAQETGSKSVPQNSLIVQFIATPTQSLARPKNGLTSSVFS